MSPRTGSDPFEFMDCIHYRIKEDRRILSLKAHMVLGVTTEVYKERLNITVGTNESSKFWIRMLSDRNGKIFPPQTQKNLQPQN
ncbi:transposase [Acetatifactor aquisgranensis]|uniref:transposase n=1 Tax=Acetatifactor aquisgranensis TaxID=2941233 RepID=UPI00203A44BD|nr:transposase [Acetatifactor aquisgranensis]